MAMLNNQTVAQILKLFWDIRVSNIAENHMIWPYLAAALSRHELARWSLGVEITR